MIISGIWFSFALGGHPCINHSPLSGLMVYWDILLQRIKSTYHEQSFSIFYLPYLLSTSKKRNNVITNMHFHFRYRLYIYSFKDIEVLFLLGYFPWRLSTILYLIALFSFINQSPAWLTKYTTTVRWPGKWNSHRLPESLQTENFHSPSVVADMLWNENTCLQLYTFENCTCETNRAHENAWQIRLQKYFVCFSTFQPFKAVGSHRHVQFYTKM